MKRTFAQAREKVPSIVFLDEIDSFPNRSELTHDRKDWDIQVVNALLAELDGIAGREGVVVIGACNNAHLLDPALVRSGRLDRRIEIGLPGKEELAAIFRVHLGPELHHEDLDGVALRALGCSGADVERFVREARRLARQADRELLLSDLLAVVSGSGRLSPEERWISAVHEAGHAVLALRHGLPVHALTTQQTASGWGPNTSRMPRTRDIDCLLVVLLGGRAAEKIILGGPSSGAGGTGDSDLGRATAIAATAEASLGLGEPPDLLWRDVPQQAGELRSWLTADPALAARVRTRLEEAYQVALEEVRAEAAAIKAIAGRLLDAGFLDGGEVQTLLQANSAPRKSASCVRSQQFRSPCAVDSMSVWATIDRLLRTWYETARMTNRTIPLPT